MSKSKSPIESPVEALIDATMMLSKRVDAMQFGDPVTHVYNPLSYAADLHHQYLRMCQPASCKIVLLGMNPGPWGMAQTGVPFGEIAAVRDFLKIDGVVASPPDPHPKRPVVGMACEKSEVSGRRLWGLFQKKFGTASSFFKHHFVLNYCPLVFMESSARNRTPDKLPADQRKPLDEACDQHLAEYLRILQPKHLVGIGVYAEKCFQRVAPTVCDDASIHRVLHPSPASPAANTDWAGKVTATMIDAGLW
ncbi:MAG: uracil-DNA glycosylase family protein [Planctomycetota bacterium]